MEQWKKELVPLLPHAVQEVLYAIEDDEMLTEIHLRADLPMQLTFVNRDRLVYATGGGPLLTKKDCEKLLSALCEHSIYAWEKELANGFFTISGGYRVGLAGRTVQQENGKMRYTSVTGFCIRIVRAVRDAAIPLLPYVTNNGRWLSTMLLSPPGGGKTTVLRDLIRLISTGTETISPLRICAADERFELGGSADGDRAFDLGPRTDLISGMAKADALERMLAALSPQALAVDELVDEHDMAAIRYARAGGVIVFATIHAGSITDLKHRAQTIKMTEDKVFDRYILLHQTKSPGTIKAVWDADGHEMTRNSIC